MKTRSLADSFSGVLRKSQTSAIVRRPGVGTVSYAAAARFGRGRPCDLADLGALAVGRVAGRDALDHHVLSRGAGDHELVRAVAADGAALGLDGHIREAAAVEDPAIGLVHHVVGGVQLVEARAEGVGVLHHELAGAEDAEPGPRLVAELGLDLVERHRELAIRLDEVADDVRHRLLVGRAEDDVAVAAEGEFHQDSAHVAVAAGLLPDLHRLQRGHEQLQGAGGVHLLADDPRRLVQHAEAEREVGVGPRAELTDHAGAEEQDMAGRDGVRRRFLLGRNQGLRPAHGQVPRSRVDDGDRRRETPDSVADHKRSGSPPERARDFPTARFPARPPGGSGRPEADSLPHPPHRPRAPRGGFAPGGGTAMHTLRGSVGAPGASRPRGVRIGSRLPPMS